MANEQNLIPMSRRSKKEARESGRKGGIASGEARRKKKSFAEAARWALEMETKANIGNREEVVTQYQAIVLTLLSAARDKKNKPKGSQSQDPFWDQAAQMLLQIENSEANVERVKAETERIRAATEAMRGNGEPRNGVLEQLIEGLRNDLYTETACSNETMADGET